MRNLKVTVTVADLDQAIENFERGGDICATCLIAVAGSRAAGEPLQAGVKTAWLGMDRKVEFVLPDPAKDLITEFDNENFEGLRAQLPVSFVLEACR